MNSNAPKYNVLDPNAKVKAVCYKCAYFNPEARFRYRCAVPGHCPACSPPKPASG